jgi:hypothetical protein
MTPAASTNLYKHHRFPGEIISHAVWLYFRFPLSHRDVAELLFARGIIVSYEAIRKWCRKFGQQYANQPRRWRPRPSDKWHLDEVFITIPSASTPWRFSSVLMLRSCAPGRCRGPVARQHPPLSTLQSAGQWRARRCRACEYSRLRSLFRLE